MSALRELSRNEWLKLRRETIGASEAAAACGESPYQSAIELWSYKTGLVEPPDLSDVEHILWGNLHEPTIVSETCRREGLSLLTPAEAGERLAACPDMEIVGVVDGRQLFLRSRIYPWMTATFDGFALTRKPELLVAIEAKTTGEWHHDEWADGSYPDHHLLQVTHQLAVATPVSYSILAGLVGGNKLKIAPAIARTAAPIDSLVVLEREFWRLVQAKEAPAADGSKSSAKTLKLLHPDDNGESIVLDASFCALRDQEESLAEKAKALEEEIDGVRALIRAALGPNTFGVLPNGQGTYSLKTTERDSYVVKATKYRQLRFSAPKSTKARK
jgi:predicted phage-related endonuclease